jgi:hypothetical protein
MVLAEDVEARQPVELGHPEVEQHDVGFRGADERQNLLARVRFPNDFDVRLRVEYDPYAIEC